MAAEGYTKEGSGGGAGLAGAVGPAGAAGADGDDGAAGDAGAAGPAGAAGATGAAGPDLSAVTEGALVKRTSGVPAAANPALDYVSPLITAPVASATTITLPETGGIVPVTGTTTIDYITKPTGNVPRAVILWFQGAGLYVRHNVASAPAGTANIYLNQAAANNFSVVPSPLSFWTLVFDGTKWYRIGDFAHSDGQYIFGSHASATVNLSSGGAQLQWLGTGLVINASAATLTHATKITLDGRVALYQGTLASASNMTFTRSSILVTGTTTMNTFNATSWLPGAILRLTFAGILTVTHNSGGASSTYRTKDGANITTSAGLVLDFQYDGTDFREVGAPSAGVSFSGVTEGAIAKKVGGVPVTAVNQIDYIGPQKTADVASAATITLPETGLLVPITGTTTIDYITKPTGDAPRLVVLRFASALTVRHEVAGAGGGAAHISLLSGLSANAAASFTANQLLPLLFDGTIWRKLGTDGSGVIGNFGDFNYLQATPAAAILSCGAAIDLQLAASYATLRFGSSKTLRIDSSGLHLNDTTAIEMNGRAFFTQASVASASNMVFTKSSMLVTGTADMNTFTPTSWTTGGMLWLTFADILNINSNSGGANDYVSKDGTAIITTVPGMVLGFRFNGTDFVEVGR